MRESKEGLFEKPYYKQVFPSGEPYFYLTRYWLMRDVGYAAKGYPERAYAKWLVLHAMWGHMRRVLDGRLAKEACREAWEKSVDRIEKPLYTANDRMFRAALQFYRARRGHGARALDPSSFFKRKNLHREFDRFWRGFGNSHRGAFTKAWRRFSRELRAVSRRV